MKLSRDVNGNKTLNVGKFSIQTLGNLSRVHRMSKDDLKETLNQGIALTEARAYVVEFGTKRQKELLGV